MDQESLNDTDGSVFCLVFFLVLFFPKVNHIYLDSTWAALCIGGKHCCKKAILDVLPMSEGVFSTQNPNTCMFRPIVDFKSPSVWMWESMVCACALGCIGNRCRMYFLPLLLYNGIGPRTPAILVPHLGTKWFKKINGWIWSSQLACDIYDLVNTCCKPSEIWTHPLELRPSSYQPGPLTLACPIL